MGKECVEVLDKTDEEFNPRSDKDALDDWENETYSWR